MLEINNLKFNYNKNFKLENISFKLEKNCIFGIIGPNGSGKTTLLRSIIKLIHINSGEIIFNKQNILEMTQTEIAKNICYVNQNPMRDFKISVLDYVLLGRIPHRQKFQFFESKIDIQKSIEAMEITDTIHLKNRAINNLSGGELQLVVLAKALAQEPKLLLLDEPTNHLDIAHQIQILDLLKKLNKTQNLTIIIVLHDLNLASEYCEKLLLLNSGTVHMNGSPREVLTYQNIEKVYKTVVIVKDNPISKKPCIFPISKELINTNA